MTTRKITSTHRRAGGDSSRPAPQKRSVRPRPCRAPRPGQKCPRCGRGHLDYDGLLQLTCPACGYIANAGGFT